MPLPDVVEAIQPQIMREEVYLAIRRWIVDGVLLPGEKMRDIELAERLGVSRMPVREALNRLSDEGLVEMARNRWTRVTPIDREDARRIYPLVWSLEPLAIAMAGERLTGENLDEMADHNERLAQAIGVGDPVEASQADAAFHQVYVDAAANIELAKILAGLKVKLRRLEVAYFGGSLVASRSVEEHRELLDALRVGDFEGAADLVRQNWMQSYDRIVSRQQETGDPRRPRQRAEPAPTGQEIA